MTRSLIVRDSLTNGQGFELFDAKGDFAQSAERRYDIFFDNGCVDLPALVFRRVTSSSRAIARERSTAEVELGTIMGCGRLTILLPECDGCRRLAPNRAASKRTQIAVPCRQQNGRRGWSKDVVLLAAVITQMATSHSRRR